MSEGTTEREEAYRLEGRLQGEMKQVFAFLHEQISRLQAANARADAEMESNHRLIARNLELENLITETTARADSLQREVDGLKREVAFLTQKEQT